MKKMMLPVLSVFIFCQLHAQIKPREFCGTFVVDILDGTVNGLPPDLHPDKIKEKLPCFTSAEDEGNTARCGGGVYFKDKDIYFFTQRDYVEIGEKFNGKLSIPLMNAKRNSLYKWLGHPLMKDPDWEAYQTAYGCIILYFNKAGLVKKIRFSTEGTGTLKLCE